MTHSQKIDKLAIYCSHLDNQDINWSDFATAILAKVESMELTSPNKTVADLIEAQKIEIMRLREEVRKLKEGA